MKKFNNIIKQDTEPTDTNALWLRDGVIYEYEGGWKPALKSNSSTANTPAIPVFEVGTSQNVIGKNLSNKNRMFNNISYLAYIEDDLTNRMEVVFAFNNDDGTVSFMNVVTGSPLASLDNDGVLHPIDADSSIDN